MVKQNPSGPAGRARSPLTPRGRLARNAPETPALRRALEKNITSRSAFIDSVIDHFGSEGAAAKALGVTRAALWQWSNNSLSVEGAVSIAEALNLPYEDALLWATFRREITSPEAETGEARAA